MKGSLGVKNSSKNHLKPRDEARVSCVLQLEANCLLLLVPLTAGTSPGSGAVSWERWWGRDEAP